MTYDTTSPCRDAPSTWRNRDPILSVLQSVLPREGTVLEIASGTGQHIVYFAKALPALTFQPSDRNSESLDSITAWIHQAALRNVMHPVSIDVTWETWPIEVADAIVCINMCHIAPWESTLGLIAGARRLLTAGAPVVIYGPFKKDGRHTSLGNEEFDCSLRTQDPTWGIRDMGDVAAAAEQGGFLLDQTIDMPANNMTLVFRRL